MDHWYSTSASGEKVNYENWNELVNDVHISHTGDISGSYIAHSSNTDIHFPSSNITSWLDNVYLKNIKDGEDINSFDSNTFHSSGIVWNKTTGKWDAVAVGSNAGPAQNLSNITINTDKDWLYYNITKLGGIQVSGDITVEVDSQHDIGTNTNRFDNIYADDLWGNPHYQDMYFKETWCDICGDTFKKGEPILLIVKEVKEETASVPVHLKCALNKL